MNIAPRRIGEDLESDPVAFETEAVGVPDDHSNETLVPFTVPRSEIDSDERELFASRDAGLRIHLMESRETGRTAAVKRRHSPNEAEKPYTEGATSKLPFLCAGGVNYHLMERTRKAERRSSENQGVKPDGEFLSPSGHSPITIKCLSRAREMMPIAFPLSDSLENSSVAKHIAIGRRVLNHWSWGYSVASEDDSWDA